MSDSPAVLYEVAERIATITLNRPEKRNALGPDLLQALAAALDRALADPEVGAIILTGAGDKAFCAGGDLGAASGDGLLAMHAARKLFADMLVRFTELDKPIVGAANGHALAGGFGFLLACDLVVARADARYGVPEIKRGLFPMMILTVLLKVLGRRRTLDLALTGREVDGDTLLAWGVVNHSVPADRVMPMARELAATLAALSPAILGLGRRAIFAVEDLPTERALEHLRAQLTINTLAEDAAEGVAAFFEKRPPVWKGK